MNNDTQYFRQLRTKAIALVEQTPGISLANLAVKLGIAPYKEGGGGVSNRLRGLRKAIAGYCEERQPQFARNKELPNIYPIGYQFPERQQPKVVKSVPCKVYRRGDEGYEQIIREMMRKSA